MEKQISVTCSEYVLVAFGTQHAVRMRRITLSYVACIVVRYFSTFLVNGTIFRRVIY
jgi:hypothetical protein